jgi:hypothetical protein
MRADCAKPKNGGEHSQTGEDEWTKGPEKLRRIIELTEQWQSQ